MGDNRCKRWTVRQYSDQAVKFCYFIHSKIKESKQDVGKRYEGANIVSGEQSLRAQALSLNIVSRK